MILLASGCDCFYISDGEFGYDDVLSWGSEAPVCNHGIKQSPIDLGAGARVRKVKKPPIEFVNYRLKPIVLNVLNDGHTGDYSYIRMGI